MAWARAGAGYLVEAVADGPTCQKAVIVHVVRRPDGAPEWSDVVLAEWRFVEESPRDSAAMEKVLAQMLVDGLRGVVGSEQLPEWKQGEEGTLRRGARCGTPRPVWNAPHGMRCARRDGRSSPTCREQRVSASSFSAPTDRSPRPAISCRDFWP